MICRRYIQCKRFLVFTREPSDDESENKCECRQLIAQTRTKSKPNRFCRVAHLFRSGIFSLSLSLGHHCENIDSVYCLADRANAAEVLRETDARVAAFQRGQNRVPRPKMLVSVALLAERFGTHAARVRPVAGVDALVVLQRVRPVEALLARLAAVAPLPAVDQAVLVVDGPREEGLVAHAALVRPLARVALADVVVEVRPNRKAPTAARTRAPEWLYACIRKTRVIEETVEQNLTGIPLWKRRC